MSPTNAKLMEVLGLEKQSIFSCTVGRLLMLRCTFVSLYQPDSFYIYLGFCTFDWNHNRCIVWNKLKHYLHAFVPHL